MRFATHNVPKNDHAKLMPTLEALETAIADYKRANTAFAELMTRRESVQAQLNTIDGQLSAAKASVAANEEALRNAAVQFSRGGK